MFSLPFIANVLQYTKKMGVNQTSFYLGGALYPGTSGSGRKGTARSPLGLGDAMQSLDSRPHTRWFTAEKNNMCKKKGGGMPTQTKSYIPRLP